MRKKILFFIELFILSSVLLMGCSKDNVDNKSVKTETTAKQETETSEKTTEPSKETETTMVKENETTSQEKSTTNEMPSTTFIQEENTTTKQTETTTTQKQETGTTKKEETTTTKKQEVSTTAEQEETTKEEETTTQKPVEKSWFEKNGFTYSEYREIFTYCGSTDEGHYCQETVFSKSVLDDGTIQCFYGVTAPSGCQGAYRIFAVDKYTGVCIEYSAELEYDGSKKIDDVTVESNGKNVTIKHISYGGAPRYVVYPADYDGIILVAVFFESYFDSSEGINSGKLTLLEEYVDINTAKMLFFEIK